MFGRSSLASCLAGLLLLSASPALALTQPDNTPIPQGNGLQGLFTARGEAINALGAASTTPETFVPSCSLQFEVLQRNAGYKNSFGWYNATGQKPQDSELHEFLTCNDDVGTIKTLSIKLDPAYLGGEIGFYQATGSCATIASHDDIFYSEPAYNPDGNAANPFIHLLIYDSTVVPKAFYFGWEDLLSGGDNDFDDLTTFVTGITCTGGGGDCPTGLLGVCSDGTLQCQNGQLVCVQHTQPGTEKCDGLDNDCDGTTDVGDLCPNDEICDKGTCVPSCNGGEFTCPPDKVCSPEGTCVDPDCLPVDCPEGEKCVAGVCVGPCDGVVCPYGLVCRVGSCVDPCLGVTCDPEQVCVAGTCVDDCACAGCPASETCQADGRCLPTLCVGVNCPVGMYCAPDGTCADACAGAICPESGLCVEGLCTDNPTGAAGSGGGPIFADGGGGSVPSEVASGTGAGSSGVGGAPSSNGGTGSESGCGCRAAGEDAPGGRALAAMALIAAIGLSRRARRSARS